uniref:Uncharacterized protein n=1 Tax=Ciona intestinalis TaxID=7719 RepID=H2Y1X9_CIOIN
MVCDVTEDQADHHDKNAEKLARKAAEENRTKKNKDEDAIKDTRFEI